MKNSKVTIQSVADLAGVSRGTVDRVLNNRTNVSKKTYAKVLQALEETGYMLPRDAHEKSIRLSHFSPIKLGVILPAWTGYFKQEVLKGVNQAQQELQDFYVNILIEQCESDTPLECIDKIDKLVKKGIKGLSICTFTAMDIVNKINDLVSSDIPVITFNSDLPTTNRSAFCGQDYTKSGKIAAELMSKCINPTSNIIACVGNLEFEGHRERLEGFIEHITMLGYKEEQLIILETFNSYSVTFKKLSTALSTIPNIGGIYMANRSVSGCADAIKEHANCSIPKIICHDTPISTQNLLKNGQIDFTISQDLVNQGYMPLIMLRNYLQKNIPIQTSNGISNIQIICSQTL
ncbi:MAG: LacI family transcriptional regulator [Epulopiscium sp. Nuni2H_MBin003]|nr:MAG: LacI family transcriptional regulator [Epulopiscium sp. Nuni2H_MBin003]